MFHENTLNITVQSYQLFKETSFKKYLLKIHVNIFLKYQSLLPIACAIRVKTYCQAIPINFVIASKKGASFQ